MMYFYTHTHTHKRSLFSLIMVFIVSINSIYSQKNDASPTLTPDGLFDKVFDDKGSIYDLSDIQVNKTSTASNGTAIVNTLLCTSGIFELYFETGSGMEIVGNTAHDQRRAILCQAFQDISDFINTPLKTSGNTTKIKIWVRNPANLTPAMPAAAAGVASAFYNVPTGLIAYNGGIVDSEIWKTIHTGVNSYDNTVFPIVTTELTGGFYHGYVAFNFAGTVNWNLDYTKYDAITGYILNNTDFYTTIIHELTHALGFNSLLNYQGSSNLLFTTNGQYGVYYTRYDTFLTTSTNVKLINNNPIASNGQMYNYSFIPLASNLYPGCTSSPPIFSGNSGLFNCPTAIKYVGGVTVPVYNPPCYENGSSLSHFEDACFNGNSNDQYFIMSERASGIYAKRFLKPEERQVLCDIGYSVKGVFGNASNFTYRSYGVPDCSGITVAGVNDGFTAMGVYAFQGNSGTDITISGILNNDFTAGSLTNLRFEFVQDLYDPNASIPVNTGSSTTSFTFKSFVPGIHLLRYVPYDILTGQRGNIAYIYVNVFNNCAVTNPCSLVRNGNFEEHNFAPTFTSQIYKSCGWQNASYKTTSEYYNSDATIPSLSIPCNLLGNQPDKIVGNHAYAGMFIGPRSSTFGLLQNVYSESIKTELITTLMTNTQYQLTFDVSLAESRSQRAIKFQAFITDINLELTTGGIIPTSSVTSDTIFLSNPTFSNAASAASDGWEKITFTFTTGSNPNLKYLYIGGLNNVQFNIESLLLTNPCTISITPSPQDSYYYVDNVSLIPILPTGFLDAVNDDFSSMPIDSTLGGVVAASVYSNDLYNGSPSSAANISNVTFSLVSPLSIPGAAINSFGLITIPPSTLAGTYTLTYEIITVGDCGSFDTATVILYVSNFMSTPNISSSIRANNWVRLIELQNTGKMIVAGAFTTYNNIAKNNFARLNTDLTLDPTFTSTGSNTYRQQAQDIAIQTDNKIVVAGWFSGFSGGSNGFGIARLLPDGPIDTGFNIGGVGTAGNLSAFVPQQTNNMPYTCAVQGDKLILLGGDFYSYNGVKKLGIVRLKEDGSIDPNFNPIELNTYYRSVPTKVLIQPNGQILLLGYFSPTSSGGQKNLIRLNANGTIDPSFTMGYITGSANYFNISTSLYSALSRMVLQPDNSIVVVGAFTKYNGTNVKSIVRLLPNGQIDLAFNTTVGVERAINSVVIEPSSNKILIGGEFTTFGGSPVKKLIRLTTSGNLDATFNIGSGTIGMLPSPSCFYCSNQIKVLKKQSDGKVIVGGDFISFNAITAGNITRIFGDAGVQAKNSIVEYQSEPEIDSFFENKILVYPNPSKDIFNIDLTEEATEYTEITIFNLLGEKVYHNTLTPKEVNTITLASLATGYYMAKLSNEVHSTTVKLIKN